MMDALPWDAIGKLLLGVVALAIGAAGWKGRGKWKAEAEAARRDLDAIVEATDVQEQARLIAAQPRRSDGSGLLDRRRARRERRMPKPPDPDPGA